ncbi:MAG: hypothetical protein LUD02_09450 [Tannerellaceae bacterium]|nr:hypothetical protein [Tannerellaceae bacterium]
MEKLFKKEELLWENLLLKAIENKEIKNDIDVKMTVAHFRSMFFGLSFQHSLTCGLNTDLLRSLF